ncbi:hypothetical protein R3I94_001700 [Phoxinus phoxinus]|uniref:Uncharacterized protein n=1 Tax=Phoxinus phoxinus TaxID=58324 RepID=A0AAN9CGL9_9TELE
MQEGLADKITKAVKDAIQAVQSAPSHPVDIDNYHDKWQIFITVKFKRTSL